MSVERAMVYQEINLIPEEKLADIYHWLRSLRLDAERVKEPAPSVMRFAGAWQDMPDEMFAAFLGEITDRRHRAFARRRQDETITH